MIPAPAPHPARGFTLIELLVVLVIISVLTTLVVFRTGASSDFRRAVSAVQRLHAALQLATEESTLSGREMGFQVQPDSYTFMLIDGGNWVEIVGDPALQRQLIPAQLQVSLSLDGAPVDLLIAAEQLEPTPQVMILSSGELTPFELTLSAAAGGPRWVITGTWDGLITVERSDDDR